MKDYRDSGLRRSLLLGLMMVLLSGCATEPYEPMVYVAPDYNKARYTRVGVLINRMGNIEDNRGFIMPATLETDYSERVPIPMEYGSSATPRDVYIGDQKRIRESIPDYPDYRPESRFKYVRYYKDVTREIFENVATTLSMKGYSVTEIREAEKSWPRRFSESTIEEILERLKGSADVLFIMHYMDKGPYLWDSINLKTSADGFSVLKYSMSMFDVRSKERILFVEYEEIPVYQAIAGDPEIKEDPQLMKKAEKVKWNNFTGRGLYKENASINLMFTEEEIIHLVMKYMRRGLVFDYYYDSTSYQTVTIKGLEELIP